jgi:hypothetical protein
MEPSYSCVRTGGETDKHHEKGSPLGNFANERECITYVYVYRVSGLEVYKNTCLCFST